MKLPSRKSENAQAENTSQTRAPEVDKKSSTLKYSLISFCGALAGLLSALSVIYLMLVVQGNSEYRRTLAEAQLNKSTVLVNQQLRRLTAQLQGIAANENVINAIESGDEAALDQLELLFASSLPKALQVRMLPKGEVIKDESGPAPMNFSARDMVSNAQRGSQNIFPEVHVVGDKKLLLAVEPIRAKQGGSIIGVVLASWDAELLKSLFQGVDHALGEVSLKQNFNGSVQQLVTVGTAGAGQSSSRSVTASKYWSIEFTPSATFAEGGPNSMLLLLIALITGLGCILISAFVAHRMFIREAREDTALLVTFIQQLLARKPAQSNAFALEIFHRVALSVEQFVERMRAQEESSRPMQKAPTDKAVPSMQVDGDQYEAGRDENEEGLADEEPLFQSSDILDIAELDQDEDLLLGDDNPMVGQSSDIPASIFRAYDIRGVVGDTLQSDTVRLIGMAVGSETLAQGEHTLVVGYDGRLSSPDISESLVQGILLTGCNVINIGMVPTPVLYFATHELDSSSGVMVTGSHNPPDYNGFKIVIGGHTLANEDIQKLYQRIRSGDFSSGQGELSQVDVRESYVERIRDDVAIARPLKVVIDCGNGVAGDIAPQLFEELGCDVVPLFCDVDGNFPNHHPDPGKPGNLQDLIERVRTEGADIGIAFDGDGDRLGVVTNEGKIIYPDRLLMLFAKDVVSRNPGADVIFDVKCTRRLTSLVSGYGGRPVMWKTGHSLMKAKMKETGALLAGEMSGHIFFKERWYGFDDGLYSAARLLEIVGVELRPVQEIFNEFPEGISTPEINIKVTDESKFELVEKLLQLAKAGKFGKGSINAIDGLRIDYPVGWGLVRASNTTPDLVLRFEADTQEALEKLQALFKQQLFAVDSSLQIPF